MSYRQDLFMDELAWLDWNKPLQIPPLRLGNHCGQSLDLEQVAGLEDVFWEQTCQVGGVSWAWRLL